MTDEKLDDSKAYGYWEQMYNFGVSVTDHNRGVISVYIWQLVGKLESIEALYVNALCINQKISDIIVYTRKIIEFLNMPLSEIPLHINDPSPYKECAAWLLKLPHPMEEYRELWKGIFAKK